MPTEIDTTSLVKTAYYLGIRTANHLNGLARSANMDAVPDLLISISKGDFTLEPSAAELRISHTDCPDDIESVVADNIKFERGVVNIILTKRQ